MQFSFQELKHHFYDWCSQLTIDECVSNEALIPLIEKLERLLIELAR